MTPARTGIDGGTDGGIDVEDDDFFTISKEDGGAGLGGKQGDGLYADEFGLGHGGSVHDFGEIASGFVGEKERGLTWGRFGVRVAGL